MNEYKVLKAFYEVIRESLEWALDWDNPDDKNEYAKFVDGASAMAETLLFECKKDTEKEN